MASPPTLKKILILILVLVSISSTGIARRLRDKSRVQVGLVTKSASRGLLNQHGKMGAHPRSGMVKTNDYSSYDTAPSLEQPPSKLIPN